MADIAENAPFTDPETAISQGKRHLLVRDYSMAVTALAQACELLAAKNGDMSDELGEPYLLYGRALLYLAREEAGVLGTGVPGTEEAEEEDEEGGEEEEEEEDNADDKEDDKVETEKAESSADKTEKTKECSESMEKKTESISEVNTGEAEKMAESTELKDNNKKSEQEESKIDKNSEDAGETSTACSSKTETLTNGKNIDTVQNGVTEDNEDADSEDVNKEDEEDVHNLQVAWEVLELAKMVLLKRGPPGWKLLAEAHRLLGEVAMEGGNHQGALIDLKACLDLLNRVEPKEPRVIAETHYQLGLAHSLGNEFDESIEQFNTATTLLEARIKELEVMTESPKTDDPFYTIDGEIKELKELLPEIQEKIADMKDFKQEACKVVLEGIRNRAAEGGCSNGAGPSGEGSSASTSIPTKPASDISHLVRKKRKADDPEVASPCKKPSL